MAKVQQQASFDSFDEGVAAYTKLKESGANGLQLIATVDDQGKEHISLGWQEEREL